VFEISNSIELVTGVLGSRTITSPLSGV